MQKLKERIRKNKHLYAFLKYVLDFIRKLKMFLWVIFHHGLLNRIKNAPLTDLELLSYDIPFLITTELHESNDFYSQAKTLKKYCGLDAGYKIKCVIEHAALLTDQVWDHDINNDFPCAISMSKIRTPIFEKVGKKHIAIGPYIAYADNFLSDDQIKKERERLGKTLLVFQMHSFKNTKVKYDINTMVESIKRFATKYDTVRVCLYFMDIQFGLHKPYQDAGFECVSAGHYFSDNFLSRLKSIIELSDMTMSFGYGTSLDYCIYMNKPHYLMRLDWDFDPSVTEKQAYEEQQLIKGMIDRVNNLFDNFEEKITPEQREFVDTYCGVSCLKTKDELRAIFNEFETIYTMRNRSKLKNRV